MLWNKSLKQITTVSVALCLGMVISPRLSERAEAQTPTNSLSGNPSSSWLVSQAFNPPDRGAPKRTTEGGTRGCGEYKPGQKRLTSLTPDTAMPLTVAQHPTWYWYVPGSGPQTLEFELVDGSNEEEVVYTTQIEISEGGIISHTLPADEVAPLVLGKTYHWYLKMVCDPQDRSGDLVVDGWIERIEADRSVTAALENAISASDRATIYARAGIWHDALHTLADLRRDNPQDPSLFTRWEKFLHSVQLGDFAPEPLVEPTQISQE